MHLAFDLTKLKVKDGETNFRNDENFKLDLIGYLGVNFKSKQCIKHDVFSYETRELTKGDFITLDFIYGLSRHRGYKSTSVHLKYDLKIMFKDTVLGRHKVSLGAQFDFF